MLPPVTDQRLRHFERDAAHGDLQAQARLLLERVRIGDLTEERLRLAAHLGDEAANLAGTGGMEATQNLRTWLRELLRWRGAVVLRTYMAAFRLLPGHDDPVYQDVETEIRTWLESGAQRRSPVSVRLGSRRPVSRAQTHEGHVLCKSLSMMTLEMGTLSPYYLRENDPERIRAATAASQRFAPPSSGGQWRYSYTYRGDDRCWHLFRDANDSGVGASSSRVVESSPAWSPASEVRTVPLIEEPSPLEVFGITHQLIELDREDPGRVRRAAATSLLPWVLSSNTGPEAV